MIYTAVGEYLTKFVQFDFTSNESIGEFARLNCEWTYVASELLGLLLDSITEHHFENAISRVTERTKDQRHQVRINGDWRK
jgi:hypothetical protein